MEFAKKGKRSYRILDISFETIPRVSGDAIASLSFLAFGAISYCLVLDVFVNRSRSSV